MPGVSALKPIALSPALTWHELGWRTARRADDRCIAALSKSISSTPNCLRRTTISGYYSLSLFSRSDHIKPDYADA
jgi:hypothetical protein